MKVIQFPRRHANAGTDKHVAGIRYEVRLFLKGLATEGAIAAGVVLVMEDGTMHATGINIEQAMVAPMNEASAEITRMVTEAFGKEAAP